MKIDYQIDKDVLEAPVPSLLLQPLVENAVKHGFATRADYQRLATILLHPFVYRLNLVFRNHPKLFTGQKRKWNAPASSIFS